MCNPVAVMVVVTIVAAAYGAYTQYQAAKAEKDMYEYQKEVQEYNAALERQKALEAARKHRKDVQRLLATQRAKYAASGLEISEGTPLELFAQTAYEGEMDARNILYVGEMRARGFEMSADLSQFQGKVALWRGKQQAYGTLLSGAAQASGTYYAGTAGGGGGTGGGGGGGSTGANTGSGGTTIQV